MTATVPEDETVHEITGATVDSMHVVQGPAIGTPFLMLKNQAAQRTSPAQAARLIKAASDREQAVRLYKGKYTEDQKRKMGAEGNAFRNDDGTYSYPIGNTGDLHDAIMAVGRGGASHDAIRRYIRRRAKELGAEGAIPDSWSGEGKITKAMDIGEVVDDVHELHQAAEITDGDANDEAAGTVEPTHPGDPNDPGSPAWEAVDAATARGALAVVNKLTHMICKLKDREGQETVTVGGDMDHVMDLQEAEAALKFVAGTLAAFANEEQSEADGAAHEIEAQAEALGIKKSQETPVTDPIPAPAPVASEPIKKAAALDADAMKKIMKKIIEGMSDGDVAAAFADMAQHAAAAAPAEDAPADGDGDGVAAPAPAAPAAPVEKADTPPPPAPPTPAPAPGAGPAPEPIAKSQDAAPAQGGEPFDIQKALTKLGDQLTASFEDRLRAAVEQQLSPMQEEIKKMQQRVAPGGVLVNGAEMQLVTRGQAQPSDGDVAAVLRKQLDQIGNVDTRTSLESQASFALMRQLQQQAGAAPRFGPRGGMPTAPDAPKEG